MTQSKLSEAAKTFVVQSLACFDSPSVVARAVKDEFGEEITRQAVQAYDPTKHAGANISDRWRELFHATREAFLQGTAAIGIAHRAVRLRTLQRLADTAESMGAIALAARVLEQAAKESGGAYTNRKEVEHSGTVKRLVEYTDEELLAIIASGIDDD